MFSKVLVANRGEIAVRIMRALREAGVGAVAVYSEADRASMHVRMADEAYLIGPAPSKDSYLHIGRILDAARKAGADAVHPGYGFLSENAEFADACRAAGIVFIGPPAAAIALMGDKNEARRAVARAGVPVTPGSAPLEDAAAAAREGARIGFPVLLKAVAGGGGKGMRVVGSAADVESAFRGASSEAASAFGNPALYLEKYIEQPRHIEIQILADEHGNCIHLGERECSIQRRHQKVIEEAPSPIMTPELRARMGKVAVDAARAAGYRNAGTIEFLVDSDRDFYFMEMNTRLQVEHPVTELVTGLDLVRLQLAVAAREPLPLSQEDVVWRGHAIECRIYAEDPDRDFMPSPGRIHDLFEPQGPGIRLDSYVYAGYEIPMEYDPLIAKLAAWGATRPQAIERMRRALREYIISGIRTNVAFHAAVLGMPEFVRGETDTGFVPRHALQLRGRGAPVGDADIIAAAAALSEHLKRRFVEGEAQAARSRWKEAGRQEQMGSRLI